jgi:peptide/nickel transport system ATP-binding protein
MATLEVRGLSTSFFVKRGELHALQDISFSVERGQTLAIVGESGCGKSLTALSMMRLVPEPPGRIVAGSVKVDGLDLLLLPAHEMERVRGDRIAMIFQEPMTSLNPVMKVGDQVAETLLLHREMSTAAARCRTLELLDLVRISDPHLRIDEYPHRLSGGMRQRVMIAMALALEPKVLIADEPTTALDVTIQAQILDLLQSMQRQLGIALVLITHDLGVVARMADRVLVMYAGRTIEEADAATLFAHPRHPYTIGLFGSMPGQGRRKSRLKEIPGMVPALHERPAGCAFAPRCGLVQPACRAWVPTLVGADGAHAVACRVVTGGAAAAGQPHPDPGHLVALMPLPSLHSTVSDQTSINCTP